MAETIPMPINAANMSSKDKLRFMEDQINQVRAGTLEWMLCPYCGGENKPGEEVCCLLFGEAGRAVMQRMEEEEKTRFIANVYDKTAKQLVH